jgi:NNP family nitrate/nitrite transporter-like MFS transporter
MDNLEQHKIDLTAMGAILKERDTWVISLLYIGTFGSFIGFAFAFGQVLQINFAAGGQSAAQASLHAAQIAFIGPLLGSLSRVYGGKLADRIGGGRVTLWVFAGMILGAGILVGVSVLDDHTKGAATGAMMTGYVVGFIALFLLSGIGNGSVYKMIPSLFDARSRSLDVSEAERVAWSRAMSGALIGFAGAIGALGGVGINLALRQSYLTSHSATTAFVIFLAFYLVACAVTWAMYVRRPVPAPVTSVEPATDLARA